MYCYARTMVDASPVLSVCHKGSTAPDLKYEITLPIPQRYQYPTVTEFIYLMLDQALYLTLNLT